MRVPGTADSRGIELTAITYEVADGIATLTLNRPDRLNALDAAMERELLDVWDRVDADDDVRAVVVTGAGRAFCAGFDLSGGAGFDVFERAKERGTEELRPGDVPRDSGGLIAVRMFRCLKPIVAAINGVGVGFGATFPLPMDVRLASETARWGFVFSRRGMCMDAAVELVPATRGRAAEGAGVVAERPHLRRRRRRWPPASCTPLHAPDALLPAAYEMARSLVAESAPVSVALNRQLIWQMAGAAHPMDAHRMESIYIAERGPSADAREGAESFLEKRPPRFPQTVSGDLPAAVP